MSVELIAIIILIIYAGIITFLYDHRDDSDSRVSELQEQLKYSQKMLKRQYEIGKKAARLADDYTDIITGLVDNSHDFITTLCDMNVSDDKIMAAMNKEVDARMVLTKRVKELSDNFLADIQKFKNE